MANIPLLSPDEAAAFLERVKRRVRVHKNGCWVWLGRKDRDGYARLHAFGDLHQLHRLVAHVVKGPLSPELQVHHECETRGCVNPEHLLPVTATEHAAIHNAKRTACHRGHPFSPENTYRHLRRRHCKACNKIATRKYALRRKAKAMMEGNVHG